MAMPRTCFSLWNLHKLLRNSPVFVITVQFVVVVVVVVFVVIIVIVGVQLLSSVFFITCVSFPLLLLLFLFFLFSSCSPSSSCYHPLPCPHHHPSFLPRLPTSPLPLLRLPYPLLLFPSFLTTPSIFSLSPLPSLPPFVWTLTSSVRLLVYFRYQRNKYLTQWSSFIFLVKDTSHFDFWHGTS